MLEAQQQDTGSASSLINAVATIMGSFGMIIASLNLGNLIVVIGTLNIIIGLICGGAWLILTNRPFLSNLKES
jgi:DHA1 family bicyclomycin/chloramphenicol resistance-like MFS transporter